MAGHKYNTKETERTIPQRRPNLRRARRFRTTMQQLESPLVTMRRPKFTPKLPILFDDAIVEENGQLD